VIEVIKIKRRTRKRADGPTSCSVIAAELRAAPEGYLTQTGKPWYPRMVKRILDRIENPPPPEPEPEVEKPARIQKTELGSGDYLTKAEVRACRRAVHEDEGILFETLLLSGLRASELCGLQIRDLGIWRGKKQIDVREAKGGNQRVVRDLSVRLRRQLREYLRHSRAGAKGKDAVFLNKRDRQLKYSNLRDRIIKLGARAKIPTLHAHALRHTFGTFLYD